MVQTNRACVFAPGSWVSIGLIYLYGVLATASLSKIIPVLGDVGTQLGAFMAIRVIEGLIAVGAYSAAPALIMATTAPVRIRRAMAVWSTYSAVGVSLGLAL